MATSAFLSKRVVKVAPPKELPFKKSNFAGGLDTLTSIEELGENVSPYLRNVRNVHQGSIGMKKGPGFHSNAGDEAADITQTSTTGGADNALQIATWAASSFTAGASKNLTRVDLRVKLGSPTGTAPILVELWSDNNGPNAKLAGTSISVTVLTTSYQTLAARFIEAPTLVSGTKYWIVAYQQNNGTNQHLWSNSSTYTGGLTSTNSGLTWTTANGFNFTTYLSTNGGVLGGTRIRFSNGTKYDIEARKESAGTTGVYWINTSTGALTAIKTGLSSSATDYQFEFGSDTLVYVNGYDAPRQWDGSADSAVSNVNTYLASPAIVVVNHKNRWCFLEKDTNRMVFSEPGDITSYLSTNFVYVPAPKTGDPATSMFKLQDNLWLGTRKTKFTLFGSDLASFVLRQSTATKGIVNQNSVWVDGNYAYFVSDDGIYSCNGSTDELLSRAITPTFTAIPDPSLGQIIVWQNTLRWYFAELGSLVCNAMLSLDLVNGGWFYDSNAYIQRVFKYKTAGDTPYLIECSSRVGQAFKAEQQYSDLGKPIRMEYFDQPLNFGDPAVYKQILFYYVRFVAESGSYLVNCQMDKELQNSPADGFVQMQGGGTTWGSALWGAFTWGSSNFLESTIPVNGEYRWWQPRFTITGADCPIELQGYSMYYLKQQPR